MGAEVGDRGLGAVPMQVRDGGSSREGSPSVACSQPLCSATSQLTECQPEPVGVQVPFSVGEAGSVVTMGSSGPLLARPPLRLPAPPHSGWELPEELGARSGGTEVSAEWRARGNRSPTSRLGRGTSVYGPSGRKLSIQGPHDPGHHSQDREVAGFAGGATEGVLAP